MNSVTFDKYKDIPMAINTIEITYQNIVIYGSDDRGLHLYDYLRKNDNIEVQLQNGSDFVADDEVELVIYTSDKHPLVKRHNGQVVCFAEFSKDNSINIPNYIEDIFQNIVPKLNDIGARMIIVQSPNLRGYKAKLRLFGSMAIWKTVMKHSNRRDHYILKHLKCLDQEEEYRSTKADKIKGYIRVHGNGKYINYDDGFRRVPALEEIPYESPCIYLFAFCIAANPMLKDEQTIAACLQRMYGSQYRVIIKSNDSTAINLIMRETTFNSGDIIILFGSHHDVILDNIGVERVDLTDTFLRTNQLWKHITDSSFHLDAHMAQKIAKVIHEHIGDVKETDYRKTVSFGPTKKMPALLNMFDDDKLLDYYDHYLAKQIPFADVGGHNGCIVMNCNPFTYGHRYLIEQASAQVDWLFVFVVSEDRSIFEFEDRFTMVKEGTSDIKNVIVLKSSDYMISASTLPGYFDKNHLGNIKVSAKDDLQLFASIGSLLNIKIRFAGEEPNDRFTNGYNSEMANILPAYGIEFQQISRLCDGKGNVISASEVRRRIDAGTDTDLSDILPESTIKIIRGKYTRREIQNKQ